MKRAGWVLLAALAAGCGKKAETKAPPKGAMSGADSPEAAFSAVIDLMRKCDGKALWGIYSTKHRKDALAQLAETRKDPAELQKMADWLGISAERLGSAAPEEVLTEVLRKNILSPETERKFASLGAPTAWGDDRRITVTAKYGTKGATYSLVFVREGDLWKFDAEEETPEIEVIDGPK